MKRKLYYFREYCDNLKRVIASRNPAVMLDNKKLHLTQVQKRLCNAMEQNLERAHHRLSSYDALPMLMDKKLSAGRHGLSLRAARMEGLSPLLKLSQGYSLTEDAGGHVISSVHRVKKGDAIRVNVKDGYLDAVVEEISERVENG
jgi:exodeoxyribonuclease VII large subunit